MPTLFISYKRGTASIGPLMERLKAEKYRLWFDREDIHLGDPDWQARIDQGLQHAEGVILGLTPAACASEPVQYEVRKALELGKPIFPIILERIADIPVSLKQVGLSDKQHVEDFTKVEDWGRNCQKLLDDLIHQGLKVTRHDLRRQRGETEHRLHQRYLTRLVEQIGRLRLSIIHPQQLDGAALETIYVPLPTKMAIDVEIQDYRIVEWWLGERSKRDMRFTRGENVPEYARTRPERWERTALNALVGQRQEDYDRRHEAVKEAQKEKGGFYREVKNGVYPSDIPLEVQDIAASCDRLVILGGPGSGKSTFVHFLALCLAGEQLEVWTRQVNLSHLGQWPHGALTPIYIELRRWVASAYFPTSLDEDPTLDHLWAYIGNDILGSDLAAYLLDLKTDWQEGHTVLLLDGLDEVPYPRSRGALDKRQRQLKALARAFADSPSRVMVASRPYAYEGWSLPGFSSVELAPFEDEHRLQLATNLYREAMLEQAEAMAKRLNQALEDIDPELKDRPLFVTLMATLYQAGQQEGLPARKGALYRQSILLLLERWTQTKPGAKSLADLLGNLTTTDLLDKLAALAYEVHEQLGDHPGTPEIPKGLIYEHLFALEREDESVRASALLSYLSENAAVLVSPGQAAGQDVFHFAHRTFQEYLAAKHMVSLCQQQKSFVHLRELIQTRPQVWRVPGQLVGDVITDEDGDLWQVLEDLLPDDSPEILAPDNPRLWAAWLAASMVEEQRVYQQTGLRRSEKTIRENLVAWLVKLIETPRALEPRERADCGRSLGLLGDPRPGVGVKEGIPDIVWCEIPGGPFLFGSNREKDKQAMDDEPDQHEVTLPTFRIAQYPVTYAQYEAFVQDGGYEKQAYWTGAGWRHPEWGWNDPKWHISNHPVVGVTWYEAVAFCRWLSDKLGEEVRLPMEAEFEKAARGNTDWIYPYGDEFDANKGNANPTGLGRTSAVGIFPDGASPHGVLDMSGNVWEWSLSPWANPYKPHTATQVEVEGNAARVQRGGSWVNSEDFARASYRFNLHPVYRSFDIGFRVVLPLSLDNL